MTSRMHLTEKVTITLYGSVSLGELQNELLGLEWPKDSQVKFNTYNGDQRDGTTTTITITAPPRKTL